jgi:hypothetical protein
MLHTMLTAAITNARAKIRDIPALPNSSRGSLTRPGRVAIPTIDAPDLQKEATKTGRREFVIPGRATRREAGIQQYG